MALHPAHPGAIIGHEAVLALLPRLTAQTLLFSDNAPYAEGVPSPTPSVQSTPQPQVIESVGSVQANPVN